MYLTTSRAMNMVVQLGRKQNPHAVVPTDDAADHRRDDAHSDRPSRPVITRRTSER